MMKWLVGSKEQRGQRQKYNKDWVGNEIDMTRPGMTMAWGAIGR